MRAPYARFDDLVAAAAFVFPGPGLVLRADDPTEVADVLYEVDRITHDGAWAYGVVSYEAAAGLRERLPVRSPAGGGPPLAWFVVTEAPGAAPVIRPPAGCVRDYTTTKWQPAWDERAYADRVEQVRACIAAGETYQCNLTMPMRARVRGDLEQLYADLAWQQRGRHAAYVDMGRHVVVSASPELFFEWTGTTICSSPMKGTAPRGRTPAEDESRLGALRNSPKETAENVMIVDLVRNDLSQVAQIGSVTVPAMCRPERYETVWQLTSDVAATLGEGVGLRDVFDALFPAGSVTGAPKSRTMELIRELEDVPRGVYCGAVGVVAPPEAPFRARFSVAIRTVVVDRETGQAVYSTGSGITWASRPDAEHAELLAKAAILSEPYEEFVLVETLAHLPDELPGTGLRNLERHLARLSDSARYFGFRCDPAAIRAALADATAGRGPARVRVSLDREGSVAVELAEPPTPGTRPVRLAVDDRHVDSADRFRFHKTTRRRVFVEASARHPDADDVVLVNERGEVTECTIASIAVRRDGVWWTPPVTSGCLPGVERAILLERGDLRERALTVADLHAATGLAVVSSLRGWRAAVLV